ncbi:MAG: LEA type 2 family protein [Candidatus Margulisbacteria bacterium]|nr:LEA type 2 family protein [Candidatus Margulisiibacteriota bacterium]
MLKKTLIIPILISVAFILSSCIQPSPPKAEFLEYKIADITAQGIEVNFWFNVANENPLSIDVSKYDYKVFIENQELLVEERGGFNLPANSKKLIKIPVFIGYGRLFGSVLAVAQRIAEGRDTISYRIEGSLTAGTMGVTVATPIKASGTIPLPKDIKIK